MKFGLSVEEDEQTVGLQFIWLVFFFFTCLTFYGTSEYSHGDEIRRDETLMVPFGNLSNTNLCMLVCILSASALCFSVICLKLCFCGYNLKL